MSDVNSDDNEFEIRKTFMASTAHTLEEDFMLLDEAGLISDNLDYGTRIYLGIYPQCEGMPIVDHISNFNFSEGFRLLVLFAVSFDCNWLELDVDGPIYDRIPEYEW